MFDAKVNNNEIILTANGMYYNGSSIELQKMKYSLTTLKLQLI